MPRAESEGTNKRGPAGGQNANLRPQGNKQEFESQRAKDAVYGNPLQYLCQENFMDRGA